MERRSPTPPSCSRDLFAVCLLCVALVGLAEANDRLCDKYALIPGLDKLTDGVDITIFDLMPINPPYDQMTRHPLFHYTCNEKKYWTLGNMTFDLPDQIATVTTVPGGTASLETSLRKTSKETREYMNLNAGISGSIGLFSFSASASYKKNDESITKDSKYTQDVSSFTSATRAEFLPSDKLETFMSPGAQELLAQMKKPFTEDRSVYNQFIDYFGTHYFSRANLGGVLKLNLETNSNYVQGKSDKELQAEAEASFGSFISAKVGIKSTTNKQSETFNSSTSQQVDYYGGDTNLLKKEGWQKWQPSVALNPHLFKCELKPISDLITDKEKRKNLELAVDQYVLNKFFISLDKKANILKAKYPNLKVFGLIAQRLANEQRLAAGEEQQTLFSGDRLRQISDDIDYQFTAPKWLKDTKVCYTVEAVNPSLYHRCFNEKKEITKKTMCSQFGKEPPRYYDKTATNWRYVRQCKSLAFSKLCKNKPYENKQIISGCKLKWSIFSDNHPAWFKDALSLCFDYTKSPHCVKEGLPNVYECAPLNTLNKWDRGIVDKTNHFRQNCKIRWKLRVRTDIVSPPIWLTRLRFCQRYESLTGDTASCNGAKERGKTYSNCANINEWTDYYNDNTREKETCAQGWGLYSD